MKLKKPTPDPHLSDREFYLRSFTWGLPVNIGGAMVAPWHANIIINENNATQYDISKLMDYIVSIVKEKKNIELIPEIIFW